MKKTVFFLLLSVFLISIFPQKAIADTATNFDDIKFPQWAKDLRRTEIITFGSLPFVTLWTIVGYSIYEYGEFRNPLDKSTDSFTEDDTWKIIKLSSAFCLGLGLTDLTINLITRARKESKMRRQRELQAYTVTPASEMEHKPPIHEDETDEEALERMKKELEIENRPKPENYIEGVESAVF